MLQIVLLLKSRESVERLGGFSIGHNRDYAPKGPIRLFLRSTVRFERLRRFVKGDNRDFAPLSPI